MFFVVLIRRFEGLLSITWEFIGKHISLVSIELQRVKESLF